MNEVRVGENVCQEAGAGAVARPAAGLGSYVNVFDFEEVARFRALDVHRAGEGMRDLGVQAGEVCLDHAGLDLGVRGVAGFQDDLLSGVNLDDGWNVGMPAVVSELRLFLQTFGAVDGDGLHGFPPMRAICR